MNTFSRRRFVQGSMAALAGAGAAQAAGPASWGQFRGAESRGVPGVADGAGFPEKWSAAENVAWKTQIPGRGWSSPVVAGDRVFVTTAITKGQLEAPKKGLYFGGNRPEPPQGEHEWMVYCLELTSGKILWERTAHAGPARMPIHLKNSMASETPATDGKRVWVYFGGVGVFCYDIEGKELWKKPIEPRPMRFAWGTAASPVMHGGKLYILNDNEEQSHLMALDAQTGGEVWRVQRAGEKSNWATPYVWRHQRTEIIANGSGRIVSYDTEGKELWSMKGPSGNAISIATPYEAGGLLYVSSGYVGAKLRPIMAIKPGAAGDISLAENQTSGPFVAWCDWGGAPYNPTTLVYGKRLYVLFDRGLLACRDAAAGKLIYDRQRLPGISAYTASPWAANGRIYCLNEDGVTHVLADGDEFKPLHANALAEDDMGMASPAIAGDRLLLRTAARLYCIAPRRA